MACKHISLIIYCRISLYDWNAVSPWTLVLHRHHHNEQPCLSWYDFSMNTPCLHRRTVVFFFLFLFIAPPPPSSSCHWYEPLPNSNPRGQWVGGGGYRYHPNLVPRSHSVLHWKVRSPFPLAVGDLGTRLVSSKKATYVLLIFNFAETATLQGGGKIFKTMFCFSWEDRRTN